MEIESQRTVRVAPRRNQRLLLLLATLAWSTVASSSHDRGPAEARAEWVADRISRGEPADFDKKCHTTSPDPNSTDDKVWVDPCRQLPAYFIAALLTKAASNDKIASSSVEIRGARIVGDLNLISVKLRHALRLEHCRISGNIDLSHARSDDMVYVVRSDVRGSFSAEGFHGDMSLVADESEFHGKVSIENARLADDISMEGVTFDSDLNADSLQAGGSLYLNSKPDRRTRIRSMVMRSARIAGNVEAKGVMSSGDVDLDQLQVGGSLFMKSTKENNASFQRVVLRAAKVTGNVELAGATLAQDLTADRLTVGGALLIQSITDQDNHVTNQGMFQGVRLVGARIGSNLQMTGAVVDGVVDAGSIEVGGNVILRNTAFRKLVTFKLSKMAINMDLRGSTFAELQLSGVTITRDLILADTDKTYAPAAWRTADGQPGSLNLREAHIGSFADSQDAWPLRGSLRLEGFVFSRLGGSGGEGFEMRHRKLEWWDQWAQRDPDFTPMPYEQLASAFRADGDRDRADEIQYLERVQQRMTEKGGSWLFDGFLQYVAGFGIGGFTFRVLYWVVGISVVGGMYLWCRVPAARAHGPIWCLGASLSRLLPVIEVSKEFSDFFDDPNRKRLNGRQTALFAVVGMIGWVLGAILVAAVSGLTARQ